jgi:hypothetical protein
MKIICIYEHLPCDGTQMPIFLDLDKLATGCKDAKKYARAINKALKNNNEAMVDDEIMLCWGNWEYESCVKAFPCFVDARVDVYSKEE